jgi:hypothetical protein
MAGILRIIKFCLLLFLFTGTAQAQLYIRAFNFRPSGEFGFVMKPTFSLECGYSNAFENDRWRTSMSVSFIKLTPRMDVFPVVATRYDGNNKTILPGAQTFTKYNIYQFLFGIDYDLLDHEKLHLFPGTDLIMGVAPVEYTYNVPTYKSENYRGGGVLGAFRFRLGAEYAITDAISVLFAANRQYGLIMEPRTLYAANDYGLGIRVDF